MTDDSAARPEPVRASRFGLSGKLLVLTILFVMIAEVLIYVPSVANFRVELAARTTWRSPIRPRSCSKLRRTAWFPTLGQADTRLDRRARGRHEDGQSAPHARGRRHAAAIIDDIDMRNVDAFARRRCVRHDAQQQERDVMRVVGPAPMGGEYHRDRHGRAAAAPGDAALFGRTSCCCRLLISGITAALVYLSLHYMFVRPMRRVTANMMAFRADPENADRVIVPSARGRRDRHRRARTGRHAERTCLDAAAEEPARRRSGLRCRRSIMICATCLPRRSCSPTGCPSCPIPTCSVSPPS